MVLLDLLAKPDFNVRERSFHLLLLLAGRDKLFAVTTSWHANTRASYEQVAMWVKELAETIQLPEGERTVEGVLRRLLELLLQPQLQHAVISIVLLLLEEG